MPTKDWLVIFGKSLAFGLFLWCMFIALFSVLGGGR
jgi:hypothetical protein